MSCDRTGRKAVSEMDIEQMVVVEVQELCRFRSQRRLVDHVVKHVIDARDERWHQIFDGELLGVARQEDREGKWGSACRTIARQYQLFVGECLLEVCRQSRAHSHECRYKPVLSDQTDDADLRLIKGVVGQAVHAWPPEHKLLIAAEARLRKGTLGRYRLLTAFRAWPRIGPVAFQRKAREYLRHWKEYRSYRTIEVHDGDEAD